MIGSLQCRALLACALLLSGTQAMADVKDGVDAWSRGDYAAAIREWSDAADKGDADALFNLAQAYKLGRGVEQNLARAEELFGKAAARGHLQAADNYGLLLFQRGDHARALPFIRAASDRGDPRAQYVLGLAHFNGDDMPRDWVKAYALVSLAQQAGLPQAAPALAEMDQYIPLGQRQQSVRLAFQLAAQAQANRARQLAAADLNTNAPLRDAAPPAAVLVPDESAASAGADYVRPKTAAAAVPATTPLAAHVEAPTPKPAARPTMPFPAKPPSPPANAPANAPAAPHETTGKWRVQLGAFGVPGNAQAQWKRVKNRPELAGHEPLFARAGRLTLLQAGGFATRTQAQAVCSRLSAAGFDCVPAGN